VGCDIENNTAKIRRALVQLRSYIEEKANSATRLIAPSTTALHESIKRLSPVQEKAPVPTSRIRNLSESLSARHQQHFPVRFRYLAS
jgi:hypothetical protein